MCKFELNKLSELFPLALFLTNSNITARNEFIEELDKLFADIDSCMGESNKVYIESVANTKQFEYLMKELSDIVSAVNPENINFSQSFLNFTLKGYFNKINKFSDNLSKLTDESDSLIKGFKSDLITQNIELMALQNKTLKLKNLEIEINKVLDLIVLNGNKIELSNIESKLFLESRVQNSVEGKRENLMKSIIITQQRIITITLSMDNIKNIIETLKTAKNLTLEFFGVLISLANEKFKQKIISSCCVVYAGGSVSVDLAKETYKKIEQIFKN